MNSGKIHLNDKTIVSYRGPKNPIDYSKPYGWWIEKEYISPGIVEETGVIFITSVECRFRCLMCDLWKNTADSPDQVASTKEQIEWALNQMPPVKHLKLYNSGSFFDTRSVPLQEYPGIAGILNDFKTVIVESHPVFIKENVLKFKEILKPELQVAIGLETINEEILFRLNKKMTLTNFQKSVSFLNEIGIKARAFILLKPPFLDEEEGIYWAQKSIEFAFENGVECCTVIPVRAGNGIMDFLKNQKQFSPPSILSLEKVLDFGIGLKKGRVFADLWDLKQFSDCDTCFEERFNRMNVINLTQQIKSPVFCKYESDKQ